MATSFRHLSVMFCALALVSTVSGCGDDDGPGPGYVEPDSSYSCVDNDGDGLYAVADTCFDGRDCDDNNPEERDECFRCVDDAVREDCPCEPQVGMECVPPPIPVADGLLVCREGTRFCRDGLWTACEPLGEYVLVRN